LVKSVLLILKYLIQFTYRSFKKHITTVIVINNQPTFKTLLRMAQSLSSHDVHPPVRLSVCHVPVLCRNG